MMEKKTDKTLFNYSLVSIIVLIMFLVFVAIFMVYDEIENHPYNKYDPDDFMGLSSVEVVEKYGQYDWSTGETDKDGVHRNGAYGYVVVEGVDSFPFYQAEEYFMIRFDEDGIAYGYYITTRPGG